MQSVDVIERAKSGLTYAEYLALWREHLKKQMKGMDRDERKLLYYIRYNYERHERVREDYVPSQQLKEAVEAIEAPQMWMLITESWCGDSAFSSWIIREAAAAGDNIELRVLLRDENPDMMDRYLTNGSRSIPKLVAFDMHGNELFQWGPRPAELQALREQLVKEGVEGADITPRMVAWYEEGNWRQVDTELAEAIGSAVGVAA